MRLVGQLQALLHAGRLRIAKSQPEAAALAAELQDFRASFTDAGNAIFGARTGRHDDLVLALAIACWWLARHGGPSVSSRPSRLAKGLGPRGCARRGRKGLTNSSSFLTRLHFLGRNCPCSS
jgi:hypothetical protein